MKLVDPNDPFYRPLWRRVLLVLIVAAWAGAELLYGREGLWTVLALGALGFCLWTFVINWTDGSRPPGS